TAIYTLSLHDALPISKTPGAVEDGDAQFFSFDRAIHVHPVRPFPPNLLLPLRACRVHHAPGRGVQLLGQADTERPFLRVTQGDRSEEHTSELQSLAYL